jgi:prepilin-type N-terminal cleavage/methylation domain-containing protein
MQLSTAKHLNSRGFSLVEVLMALVVCVVFGVAAFTSNQRLLLALKNQKETTAATMALQWRMENFRSTAFSNIASHDYVKTNILTVRTSTDSNGNTTDPFAPLGSITEQFTIGVYPADGSTPTVMSWDANHPTGQDVTTNNSLGSATLLKVDILETWHGADGRSRTRQMSTIVGIGNIGI